MKIGSTARSMFGFLAVLALTHSLAPAQNTSTKAAGSSGRLVIIGGGLSSSNEAVYRAILDARSGKGPLCVIPTAAATAATAMDGPVATFDRYGGAGTAKGVLVDVKNPETARDPATAAQLRECSGFYFVGGVQSRVVTAFLPNGQSTPALDALRDRYRAGAVVSGSSAGAAVMSDPMIAGGTSAGAVSRGVRRTRGESAEEADSAGGVTVSRGLGFFTAALADQHFLARGRIGRLIVAIHELPEFDLGFGIDENTALVVEGEKVWPVGASSVVVLDERGAQSSGRSVNGLRLHVLSTGDSYDVTRRAVTIGEGKTALTEGGAVSAPADPFARWEFLKVLDAFARSAQKEIALPTANGSLVLEKTSAFKARSLAGQGVQNTANGLSLSELLLHLRR